MELNMNELENVTGGTNNDGGGRNCYFESEKPVIIKVEGVNKRVKCKSACSAACGCHRTTRCINRMHLIDVVAGSSIAYPYPKNSNNHSDNLKQVELPPETYLI